MEKIISRALLKDCPVVAGLGCMLWSSHDEEHMYMEMKELIDSDNAVLFIAWEDSEPVGFVQCQLRHDYVEGTSSSPVGYLEGIFVKEKNRRQGWASKMVKCCEKWAASRGCVEFASDCEINNTLSLNFHLGTGFKEANRIICFTKRIGDNNAQ